MTQTSSADRHRPDSLLHFVHIPKTGGSSMNRILRRVYGNAYARHHPGRRDIADHRHFTRVRVVSSHEGHGQLVIPPNQPFRVILPFTLVRSPLERLVSLYNFSTTTEEHRWFSHVRDMSPDEFFDALLPDMSRAPDTQTPFSKADRDQFANHQCHMIHGSSTTAAEAISTLENDYLAVAALPQHDSLISLLSRLLSWPAVKPRADERNASPHQLKVANLSSELRERIECMNSEDQLLYNHIVQRPTIQVNSLSDLRLRANTPPTVG